MYSVVTVGKKGKGKKDQWTIEKREKTTKIFFNLSILSTDYFISCRDDILSFIIYPPEPAHLIRDDIDVEYSTRLVSKNHDSCSSNQILPNGRMKKINKR